MYFVLQPLGGLNDILCTIHRCYQYCLSYKRKLIIHTAHLLEPVLFSDGIESYLCSKKEDIFLGLSGIAPVLERLAPWVDENIEGSPWSVSFDEVDAVKELDRGYHEEVIVFQGYGGGNIGVQSFNYLDLQAGLKQHVSSRLDAMPEAYHAIHFRHTDYRSSTEELRYAIETLSEDGWPIYLATDNAFVLKSMKEEFGSRILNLAFALSDNFSPIHHSSLAREKEAVYDLFVDLASLVFAGSLSCTRLTNPLVPEFQFSGFCILAQHLRKLDTRTIRSIFLD
jgi:hypothetical protein